MEGGIEAADHRDSGQRGTDGHDARKCARLVQRSKIGQCLQRGVHGGGQPHGLAEPSTAVNDPVADRVDRLVPLDEVLDRIGVIGANPWVDGGRADHKSAVVEDGELKGARTSVDDEDAHARRGLAGQ